ncbi:MAG TPA: ATP-binding protein [Gemmatimonadales bacterium]|nr:ATP-binding protein [Gemmatimonadales bacterium]
MNFTGRVVLGTSLVVLLALTVLFWSAERSFRHDLETEIGRAAERQAGLVLEALPTDSLAWRAAVRRLGQQHNLRITLIDRTGRVRAESDVADLATANIEDHADRPEVQAALEGGTGTATRRSETMGIEYHYVAVPGGPGVVRVATPLDRVEQTVRQARRSMFWAMLLALAVGTGLAYLAARSVARPLLGLTAASRAIAAGNLPRFPHSGIPDIDALVQSLRQMSQQLTERFETLRAERAESRALVESMVEAVIATDERGRIVTANPAARQLLGYAEAQPLPGALELFRARGPRAAVQEVLNGEQIAREVRFDGRSILMNGRPLPGGGMVLVMHDLSEVRRLEIVRQDFVANASHELKTPLTSITGYTETLLQDDPDPATRRRFLEVIHANAQRLQRLVDDLLDLSRIESGRWQARPDNVDVIAIARDTWQGFVERAESRRVSFEIDATADAFDAHVDPDSLQQIFTNLYDNSLRHSKDGGRIVCRIREQPDGWTVAVEDTGSGIGQEHLPRIFERFYRVDAARSRAQGGTGLGLSIVKHLVEAHGGNVSAESQLGRGTTISCWFPANV